MSGGLPGDPHLKALPPSLPASSGSFTPAAGEGKASKVVKLPLLGPGMKLLLKSYSGPYSSKNLSLNLH